MVMSRDQHAGQNYNLKINDKQYECLKGFKYLGKTAINQKCVQEEIKGRLKSGAACCRSVQNVLCSVCYPEISTLRYAEYNFACFFVWV